MEILIQNIKQKRLFQIFTIGLRYLIGAAFVFASIVKIEGRRFTSASGEGEPINTSWHYFETMYRSGLYWNFIGWGQLIAGFLLMSQRFSTLGAIAFFPIITNVFVVTISYEFAGTPVITFLMLMGNIYLLLWDWDKLKVLVSPQSASYMPANEEFMQKKAWTYLGVFYFSITVFMQKGSSLVFLHRLIHPTLFILLCLLLIVVVGIFTLIIQSKNHNT